MVSPEFSQLIKDREDWFRLTCKNRFNFTPILSGQYSDSSHFVYEIIQNAEDAKAKFVDFNLFPDRLEITHNGMPFNFKDVESITGVGLSTKTEDITAIGEFGVGFKSVFAITQSPTIQSGDFNFTIKNFVVPTINEETNFYKNTSIILPFDHQPKTAGQIHTLVKSRLESLDLLTLLFLKRIEKITWKESENSGLYERTAEEQYKGVENLRRVKLKSSSLKKEYLVFARPVSIENQEHRVEIAYKLGIDKNGNENIVPSAPSKLFVFFSTNEETHLTFLVQGPFRTTTARDNIPFEDEKNKMLIREIATLVGESLSVIRDLGFLDIDFLKVLPLTTDFITSKQKIYKAMSDKVAEKFKSNEPLIPSSRNKHCTAKEALLARSKDLTQLLDSSDTSILFKRTEWIDPDITRDRTPEIRNFFRNKLDVPEIDFETFAKELTKDFLKNKDISWLKEFYKLLKEQRSLWRSKSDRQSAGIIRTKPIIRLENNEQLEPFDAEDKPKVYLPAKEKRKTHFPTVHEDIVADEESLSFLKELGIREPDLYAEINDYIIPRYKTKQVVPSPEEYFDDFLNLMIGFRDIQSNKKQQFIDSLRMLPFIICTKADSSKIILAQPTKTYFPTLELQKYFSGFDNALFASTELYKKFEGLFEKTKIDQFLKELGVATLPRRIKCQTQLSWDEKMKLRGGVGWTHDVDTYDYDIDGLSYFLLNITKDRSELLWSILLEHIEDFDKQAENFFKGKYSWFYRCQYSQNFDAKFTQTLRDKEWLFDKANIAIKPSSISASQLSSDYDCTSPASQILIRQLQFKSDIQQQLLEQLPEEKRKNFETLLTLSTEELDQMVSLVKNKTPQQKPTEDNDHPEWKPEVGPGEAGISERPYTPLEPRLPNPEPPNPEPPGPTPPKSPDPTPVPEPEPIYAKEIGRWGEEYIFEVLKKSVSDGEMEDTETGVRKTSQDGKVIDIIWLNINEDRGVGYDFLIKENDSETAYVEVKSTLENENHLFPITGTQWEFARKLFDEERGDSYWIYCVFNAGKEDCYYIKIQNPIKLWKEGNLYAQAINFKL
jgi:hypothetical protein